MDTRIEAYYNNPSENFRYSLMNNYAEFYTSIMNYIGKRNQLIITSLRNSVEHGNYLVRKNGYLGLYDQIDDIAMLRITKNFMWCFTSTII